MVVLIKHELGIFLIFGLLTVGIDFLIYLGFIYLKPFGLDSINIAQVLALLAELYLPTLLIFFGLLINKLLVLAAC